MAPSFVRDIEANTGDITSVRGGVVDVRFAALLPAIHSLLHTGADGDVAVEVFDPQHGGAA